MLQKLKVFFTSLVTGNTKEKLNVVYLVIICHYQSLACYIIGTGQGECLDVNQNHQDAEDVKNGTKDEQKKLEISHSWSLTEFSWDEQGFSLMSSLYSDMAHHIDDKLR